MVLYTFFIPFRKIPSSKSFALWGLTSQNCCIVPILTKKVLAGSFMVGGLSDAKTSLEM